MIDEPFKINDDGTITVKKEADTRKTIDLIIKKLEKKAGGYSYLLSSQLNKKSKPPITIPLSKTVGDIIPKLADLYLVKAALIYDTHLNQLKLKTSEKEYKKETDLAIKLIDMATDLKPDIKLKKEYGISYIEPPLPNKDEQTYGYQVAVKFPKNIVEFVNESLETNLIYKKIDEKLGLTERFKPKRTK